MAWRNVWCFGLLASLVVGCEAPSGSTRARAPSDVAEGARGQPPAVVRASCLGYDTTVVLSGVVRRETHPGPPDFESVATGDDAQTGFYLHLATPICTNQDRSIPDGASRDAVGRVQLVLDSAGFVLFRRSVDRHVTVSGVLFSSITGHHHAPLVLTGVTRVP